MSCKKLGGRGEGGCTTYGGIDTATNPCTIMHCNSFARVARHVGYWPRIVFRAVWYWPSLHTPARVSAKIVHVENIDEQRRH